MNWIRVAGILGVLGIAFGAFGAHALRSVLSPELLRAYQTGVLYHLLHCPVLLGLALYGRATGTKHALVCALFLAGIALFSGSLYAMALSGVSRLGIITPIGGLLLMGGWGTTAWQASMPAKQASTKP